MRVKQVLVNLIDNAIKYTQPGEVSNDDGDVELIGPSAGGEIAVTLSAAGSRAVLKIADHGIVGVSQDALPHVFDRFYRAEYARAAASPAGWAWGWRS